MKKKTLIVLTLISFFTLFQCQTPEPKEEPKFKAPEKPTEVIDLNQIKIVPMTNPESGTLKITKNKEGKAIALLSLEDSNSGLNLAESILNGEILEHAIIIRNEKGEEIGRAPVNVLQYEIEEIATNKGEKKILLTESGSEVGIKQSNELPPVTKRAKVRTFQKNEIIPQYIELTKKPNDGTFVSVNLELIYAKPFAELHCYPSGTESDTFEYCSKDFHNSIKTEIQRNVKEKESILTNAVYNMKEDSIPKEYREKLNLRLEKNTNDYRADIKNNIGEINKLKFPDKLDRPSPGSYYYREWRLASSPKYFQVSYVDSPKTERKKKIQTDYTYFAPNDNSLEAVEEAELKKKNIVIEIDTSKLASKSEEKTEISQDSQKVSLEQAQRQEIGIGSNCIIYLKSGKFFRAKIVSLNNYESIQVEVNGTVIDVLKKDIEVIYIPKTTTD